MRLHLVSWSLIVSAVLVWAMPAAPVVAAQALSLKTRSHRQESSYIVLRDSGSVPTALARRVTVRFPNTTLERVVNEIARQAAFDVVFDAGSAVVARPMSFERRNVPARAALLEALHGSGLEARITAGGSVVRIARAPKTTSTLGQGGTIVGRVADSKTGQGLGGVDVSLEATRWRTLTGEEGRYRLADVTPGNYTLVVRRIGYLREVRSVTVVAGQEATIDMVLQPAAVRVGDLVVTAEKREERLQEVPIPVTAVQADNLVNSNQLRLQDYYTKIPGLTVGGGIGTQISLRGVTTAGFLTNPTVGIVVDDVPYGSSTGIGGGYQSIDFDPSDLARMEVLRGPQGALYGASSLGGLIKYVTVDPSTDGVSGRVQAGGSSVYNGAELGHHVRGAVNVPVSDNFAVRASAFKRRDPGYIDVPSYWGDPTRGASGINRTDAYGGRLSVLWRPSEGVSLKLSALFQESKADGNSLSFLQPGFGDLQQSYLRGTGYFNSKVHGYSATVTARLGDIDLTALSGYSTSPMDFSGDGSPFFGALAHSVFGVAGVSGNNHARTTKFTQELRLSTPIGERLEWRFGAFYAHEDARWYQDWLAVDPVTLAVAGVFNYNSHPTTYAEYAAFTDLTFRVTDQFDVQLGGRLSHIRQTYSAHWAGPFVPLFFGVPDPLIPPGERTKDHPFTFLMTPRFKVSSDLMVYARLASGYRAGGPNVNSSLQALPTYTPDKTQNYEVGIKGDVFDQQLSFDASLYYIDWKDIQLQVADRRGAAVIYINAGRAKSQGIELSLESRPLTGLTLAAWGAWNVAELTDPFPPGSLLYGDPGNRLPWSPRWSGNVSVDQNIPLASSAMGFVGGSASYVGDRSGGFRCCFEAGAAAPQPIFPSYMQGDLRAGVRYESWMVNFFVTNVTDERGTLFGDPVIATAVRYIQPRTAGLSVARTF